MKRSLSFALLAGALVAFSAPRAVSAQEASTKAAFTVDADKAKAGSKIFAQRGCNVCHSIGKGRLAGPDLAGVLERRDVDWLNKWLSNTSQMIATDPVAQQLVAEAKGIKMPDVKLNPTEIDQVLNYIAAETAKKKK